MTPSPAEMFWGGDERVSCPELDFEVEIEKIETKLIIIQ